MLPERTGPEPPREERIGEAIVSWDDARVAGRPYAPLEFLARHPDLEPELRSFLGDQGIVVPAMQPFVGGDDTRLDHFASYEILEKLGAGGVGAVFLARDRDLQRLVAIKILRDTHVENERVVARFLEEAQITAQLQHPGIVPVHEVGRLPGDDRPYIVMKYVEGTTLAALLPSLDLERRLAIFEQVCQAVAYAHEQGVLHRDLKPVNIMVGSFGEVLVMDWGLAKVLDAETKVEPAPVSDRAQETIRLSGPHEATQVGLALGTLSYMPPEQARGEINRLGFPADVYALGAILCEMLTGKPPQTGVNLDEIRGRVEVGDLSDARSRLQASQAEPALVQLVMNCLDAVPEQRPATGTLVAEAIAAHRQELRHQAEQLRIDAALGEVRLFEERRRRRRDMLLGTLLLLGVIGAGVVWSLLAWQAQHRKAMASAELAGTCGRVEQLCQEAERFVGMGRPDLALALWRQAAEALEATGLANEAEKEQRQTRDLLRGRTEAGLERASRSNKLIEDLKNAAALVGARFGEFGPISGPGVKAYQQAFQKYGTPLNETSVEELSRHLANLPGEVRTPVLAALDHLTLSVAQPDRNRLRAVLTRIDPDPVRERIRTALEHRQLPALLELASKADGLDLPATTLRLLGRTLGQLEATPQAVNLLRQAVQKYPADFWIHMELSIALVDLGPSYDEEAAGHLRAALALSPESAHAWVGLGLVLGRLGRYQDAEHCLQRSLQLAPGNIIARISGALVRMIQGDSRGASKAARAVLTLKPGEVDNPAFVMIAAILVLQDASNLILDREARQVILDEYERTPNAFMSCLARGILATRENDCALAARLFLQASREQRDSLVNATYLAMGLLYLGETHEVELLARKTLSKPIKSPLFETSLRFLLAHSLAWQGRLSEGEQVLREALRTNPTFPALMHLALGQNLLLQGQYDLAQKELEISLSNRILDPLNALRLPLGVRLEIARCKNAVNKVDAFEKVIAAGNKDVESAGFRVGLTASIQDFLYLPEVALARGKNLVAWAAYDVAFDFSTWPATWRTKMWNENELYFTHRTMAALAAIRVAEGNTREKVVVPVEERVDFRKSALIRLREEVRAQVGYARQQRLKPGARAFVNLALYGPDFAGVRDQERLAKLPEAERKQWESLWKEMRALRDSLRKGLDLPAK